MCLLRNTHFEYIMLQRMGLFVPLLKQKEAHVDEYFKFQSSQSPHLLTELYGKGFPPLFRTYTAADFKQKVNNPRILYTCREWGCHHKIKLCDLGFI